MRCLTVSECEELVLRVGLQAGDLLGRKRIGSMQHAAVFVYKSRMKGAEIVARHLADCLGNFTWALLWAHGFPWGDRSLEEDPPADWRHYAQWRESAGESRELQEAPGHLFKPTERLELVEAAEFAIYTGWDAVLFASPLDCVIALSHDDFIQIQSHENLSLLTTQLGELEITERRLDESLK